MKRKQENTLSNALDTLSELDDTPSTQETIDFVDQPVEEWLKSPNTDTLVLKTIQAESERLKSSGLDPLYIEAILKSLYGRLKKDEPIPRGMKHEQVVQHVLGRMQTSELYRGFHRIWAKNLSFSQVENIYFNAVRDARALLKELETKLASFSGASNPNESNLNGYVDLFYKRDNLYGVEMIFADWGDINDTDLDELHTGESNLQYLIKKVDKAGNQLMQHFDSLSIFSKDERLDRIVMENSWHMVDDDWWMRPTNLIIEAEIKMYEEEYMAQQRGVISKKPEKKSHSKKK